ncbi:MAG: beta-hexosaminidase [Oscillospiraceae bacterium]|nr:beta-hexosaminidase [Oscillospiraceae bacterium]
MKKLILSIILLFTVTMTGCKLSLEPEAETTVGEIVVIQPGASLDRIEPDESEVSQLQSYWEEAQHEELPAIPEEPEVIVIERETTAATTEITIETTTETATETTVETTKETTRPIVTTKPREIVIDHKNAQEILDDMTLSEKVGQIIFARYPTGAAEQMAQYKFGGYTLYAQDFNGETPTTITSELFQVSLENKLMPFFAVDEEGGNITRVSRYLAFAETRLPTIQAALKNGMSVSEWVTEMVTVLESAGINLNFAPVADVAESKEDYIYNRTVSLDCKKTGDIVAEIVEEMNRQGMIGCLKHFPGYGSNTDTHTGIAVDTRSRDDFEKKDFIPFKDGIEAGAPMVMVNHNIVEAYNDSVPASLAPEIHDVLRKMGFGGIIITDDLGMDAITLYSQDPYVEAFLAGNDMLCTSDGAETHKALYAAVLDGRITEKRLDESVLRILNVKLEYGIIG